MGPKARLRVVVADGAAVNRHVVRYFLEETGFEVVAEAARGDEVAAIVGSRHPDAVVLGHDLAVVDGLHAIPRIRQAFPSAKVVLFLPAGEAAPIDLPFRGADVYLERGVGLKDLPLVLRTLCASPYVAIDEGPALRSSSERHPPDRMRRLAQLAPVAAVSLLVASLLAGPIRAGLPEPSSEIRPVQGDPVEPPASPEVDAAVLALDIAVADLSSLIRAVQDGSPRNIAALARQLMKDRTAAIFAGADVSVLDAMIRAELAPLIERTSPENALVLRAVLGSLVGHGPLIAPPGWERGNRGGKPGGGPPSTPPLAGPPTDREGPGHGGGGQDEDGADDESDGDEGGSDGDESDDDSVIDDDDGAGDDDQDDSGDGGDSGGTDDAGDTGGSGEEGGGSGGNKGKKGKALGHGKHKAKGQAVGHDAR